MLSKRYYIDLGVYMFRDYDRLFVVSQVRDVEESKRVNANVQEWLGDRSAVPGQKEETR